MRPSSPAPGSTSSAFLAFDCPELEVLRLLDQHCWPIRSSRVLSLMSADLANLEIDQH
jgi:hypothetical protein